MRDALLVITVAILAMTMPVAAEAQTTAVGAEVEKLRQRI